MARLNANGKWIGAKSKSGNNENIDKYSSALSTIVCADILGIIIFLIFKFPLKYNGSGGFFASLCIGWLIAIFIYRGTHKWLMVISAILCLIPVLLYGYFINFDVEKENAIIETILLILGNAFVIGYNYYKLNEFIVNSK